MMMQVMMAVDDVVVITATCHQLFVVDLFHLVEFDSVWLLLMNYYGLVIMGIDKSSSWILYVRRVLSIYRYDSV